MVELGRVDAALGEAPLGGESREAGDVLHTVEALLLGCRNELSVDDERSRGIAVIGVQTEDGRHRSRVAVARDGLHPR
jgi:hypothetical protein